MAPCLCLPVCHKSVSYLLFRGCCSHWRFQPYDCAINLLGAHLDHLRRPLGGPFLLKWNQVELVLAEVSFDHSYSVFSRNSGIYKNKRYFRLQLSWTPDWEKFRGLTENDAHADQITRQEIVRHEVTGQENTNAVFRCYFLNMQRYDALCVNQCLWQIGNTV